MASNVGELWVDYEVVLHKPKWDLTNSQGLDGPGIYTRWAILGGLQLNSATNMLGVLPTIFTDDNWMKRVQFPSCHPDTPGGPMCAAVFQMHDGTGSVPNGIYFSDTAVGRWFEVLYEIQAGTDGSPQLIWASGTQPSNLTNNVLGPSVQAALTAGTISVGDLTGAIIASDAGGAPVSAFPGTSGGYWNMSMQTTGATYNCSRYYERYIFKIISGGTAAPLPAAAAALGSRLLYANPSIATTNGTLVSSAQLRIVEIPGPPTTSALTCQL